MLNNNTHINNIISDLAQEIAAESTVGNLGYTDSKISNIESELAQVWKSAGSYKSNVTFNPQDGFKAFQKTITTLEEAPQVDSGPKVIKLGNRRFQYLTGIAASAALLIGAWFLYPSDTISYINNGSTPQEFALVDGSRMFLFPGASLEIDKSFSADNRSINLNEGQVVLDVESSKIPFIMSMDANDIVVTGTKFSADFDEDNIVINLYEGSINYEYDGKIVGVKEGSKLVHDVLTGSVDKTLGVDQGLLDFANGTLSFIDTPLSEVITRLEQFYNVSFSNVDNIPSGLNFTSAVLNNQSLDNIIKTLEVSFNLEIDKVDDSNYSISF